MNFYMIVYNNMRLLDSEKIHTTIVGSTTISDWWHYLPNTYIIKTDSSVEYQADRIRKVIPSLLSFIVKIDLNIYNGYLNKAAWKWIREKTKVPVTYKAGPSPSASQSQSLPQITSAIGSTTPPKSLIDLLAELSRTTR